MQPEPGVELAKFIESSNGTLKVALGDFRNLANYINAKDYEGDKFRRGDEINARLVPAGKTCFALEQKALELYERANRKLTESSQADKTALQKAVGNDYAQLLALASALGKGPVARAEIEPLVAAVSKLVDDRQATIASANKQGGEAATSFYRAINDQVAVPLRRLLRDAAKDPKAWKDAFIERPRSTVVIARDAILRLASEDYLRVMTR